MGRGASVYRDETEPAIDRAAGEEGATLPIHVVRLGTPRLPNEGLRLGTVRRPPRGVPKTEFARRNFYDVWLPELAPSAPLVSWALADPWTPQRWRRYERLYRREMAQSGPRHLIATLAALSATASFSVGCYCADESCCHRAILRDLLADAGALMSPRT
jgi:uncharacterized protein YeaO (DUF488 family)